MNDRSSSESVEGGARGEGMSRRLVLGVAGLAAALGGIGYAVVGAGREEPNEPVPGFWGLQWENPQGAALHAKQFQGRPLLINFWATWCPPCIEELPLIDGFYRENLSNGWQVLALAVDRVSPVQTFLSKNPVEFPVGMAGLAGTELGKTLGTFSGGLPFSVAIGASGTVLHRKLGRLSAADLAQWSRLK